MVLNSMPFRISAMVASRNNTLASASSQIATISVTESFGLMVAIAIFACEAPKMISIYSIEFPATIAA
jgi:uncharacterized membrane protein